MASFALPFLSALKKQAPPDAGPDFSGMESESDPQPDLSMFQAPDAPPHPPANPLDDLAKPDSNAAPKLAGETKGHKLLRILMGAGYGAAAGAGKRTFGEGFQQAQELPLSLQHQQLQNQAALQTLPFLRQAQISGIQKNLAEAGKFGADAAKAQAEVAGMPIN